MKIKQRIQRLLGITALHDRIEQLEAEKIQLVNRFNTWEFTAREEIERTRRQLDHVCADNDLILGHIKFINSHFFVTADVSVSRYEPTVICVVKRGKQDHIYTYTFNDKLMIEIHRFLEGFGKQNVIIDQPWGSPRPKFRY